jgi:hypothetical protein
MESQAPSFRRIDDPGEDGVKNGVAARKAPGESEPHYVPSDPGAVSLS